MCDNAMNTTVTLKKQIDWFKAIFKNDKATVAKWIKSTSNIDTQDNEQCTPLLWACFLERNEIVSMLLENGANPFIKDNTGVFPWFISMCNKSDNGWETWPHQYDVFTELKNTSYVSSLVSGVIKYFIKNNDWLVLKILFDYIHPNRIKGVLYWNKDTFIYDVIPLTHLAYSLNNKKFLFLLKEYDYNLNVKDHAGNSVLDIALCDGQNEWASYLFQSGVSEYKKNLY